MGFTVTIRPEGDSGTTIQPEDLARASHSVEAYLSSLPQAGELYAENERFLTANPDVWQGSFDVLYCWTLIERQARKIAAHEVPNAHPAGLKVEIALKAH